MVELQPFVDMKHNVRNWDYTFVFVLTSRRDLHKHSSWTVRANLACPLNFHMAQTLPFGNVSSTPIAVIHQQGWLVPPYVAIASGFNKPWHCRIFLLLFPNIEFYKQFEIILVIKVLCGINQVISRRSIHPVGPVGWREKKREGRRTYSREREGSRGKGERLRCWGVGNESMIPSNFQIVVMPMLSTTAAMHSHLWRLTSDDILCHKTATPLKQLSNCNVKSTRQKITLPIYGICKTNSHILWSFHVYLLSGLCLLSGLA